MSKKEGMDTVIRQAYELMPLVDISNNPALKEGFELLVRNFREQIAAFITAHRTEIEAAQMERATA